MGVDVRWVVLLENTRQHGEWQMIEALERRLPSELAPRLSTSRDKQVRTLTIPSFARWEEVSSDAYATHRHPEIARELEEIQDIIGSLRLYYSSDLSDMPGDWLMEREVHELLETMQPVDGAFALVLDLLANEFLVTAKG